MRAALYLMLALLLQGCAGQPFDESEVSPKTPVFNAIAGNGYAAFSLAQSDYRAETVFGDLDAGRQLELRFEVRRSDDGGMFKFEGGDALAERPAFGAADEPDEIPGGRVYAHSLPPGGYEITAIYVWRVLTSPTGEVERIWRSKDEVSLRFTIEPGRSLYLGEWRCVPRASENALGVETVDDCAWEISDRFERDAPILRKKFPGLPWGELVDGTLRSGEAPAGLVTFK